MGKFQAFLAGLIFGGLAGAAAGLLSATKPGKELRHELADAYNDLYRKAMYELEEIADKVDELKVKIEKNEALHQVLEDFTPRVEAAVGKAQSALEETTKTTVQSQQLLQEKQT
ncbi:MAG TPA: YtxH domain-containing protein [Candidatus Obscuribacterales bacterium]